MNKIWYQNHPLKYLLLPLTLLFFISVKLRAYLFKLKLISKQTSKTPVIVIGNISVGGTGKTPFIMCLAMQLKQAGIKVAIVSRGYGRKGTQKIAFLDATKNTPITKGSTLEHGDEPVLIFTKTQTSVVIASKRADACAFVDQHCDADVILSDDGMQHYQMARAKEWCLLDQQRGFGNKCLLPAGPLREPMSRLNTVDAVIQQNNNNAFAEGDKAFYLALSNAYLLSNPKQTQALNAFKNKDCIAMAGIANPSRFFNALSEQGLTITGHAVADHYDFSQSDFEQWDSAKIIFITEKDAIKCSQFDLPNVWVVPVNVLLSPALEQTIAHLIEDIQHKRLKNG